MSLACPTAENNWRDDIGSRCFFKVGEPFISLRPEATDPDVTIITYMPCLYMQAIWSVNADILVMSRDPSVRVRTLLPIFITILSYAANLVEHLYVECAKI